MRVSRAQAEANRETVINVASRLFRQRGFDGIGLKELMQGAGLTQGGFYKQFESKEDLEVQASRRAMEGAITRWFAAASSSTNPLQAIVDLYLSAAHRGETGDGCPLVALGADAARQSEEVRKPFQDGINAHLEVLEGLLAQGEEQAATAQKAMAMLSMMVGAVTLARIVTDEALANCILEAASAEVMLLSANTRQV